MAETPDTGRAEAQPFDDLLPITAGAMTLRAADPAPMTALLPYPGQADAMDAALKDTHGLGWPRPGQVLRAAQAEVAWFGKDQALLIGAKPHAGLSEHAAVIDQDDGWAVALLEGAAAEDVLARMVPLDVAAMAPGDTARSLAGHMAVALTRVDAHTFRLMVFRSMAGTLVHEVGVAMRAVAARAALS